MRVLVFLTIPVAGLLMLIGAPDPFGWRFNAGLAAITCGACMLMMLPVHRLRRSPGRWRRRLGTTLLMLLLMLAALTGILWTNYHLVVFRPVSVEGWRADLGALQKALERTPPGLRERAHRCATPELTALSRDLPVLADDQRLARLIHAIACLNDGHTVDFPFFPAANFSPVPLQFRHFDDGWFVTRAAAAQSDLVGLQVVRIAGLAVEDAYHKIRPYVAADNESAARVRAPAYMLSPRLWKAIGVSTAVDGLDLEFASTSGARRAVRLQATSRLRYLWWYLEPRAWLFPPAPPAGSPPSAERKRDPWWLTPVTNRKAVYVAFRGVRDRRGETLTMFGARLLKTAKAMQADRIVIDVRDNGGGDNTLFRGFVAALAGSEFNAPGRLLVLIDGGTFSAATNFVSTMERQTRTILVGAPTGSGPNHFGDSRTLVLPRTRIAIQLSTRWHQFGDPDDVRTAHEPHVAVRVTSREYFSGRDAVLEAALDWPS
ncbi:MAG: hypothetical protein HYX25_08040 [Candidatus Solibacter usitatus]|nr:hypothetical protein [Candidatus Solibacter usitatus]